MIARPSRHAAPVLERGDGSYSILERLPSVQTIEEGRVREELLEQLVHQHPEIIPIADIEPAIAPLISVCRQLPTPAGQVDNFWVTPDGGIVLGECKLVRNPQARREVIAQALDYAGALARMKYEELETAVRQGLGSATASLWSFVSEVSELEESQFTDAVQRRLESGRFLILIIGDGIQEGAEALVSRLQLHAGMHAVLALVELSIWRIDGRKLIVPRIPLRTTLVERGIVIVDVGGGARIDAPKPSGTTQSAPRTLSEDEFYARLEANRPGLPAQLRPFIDSLAEIGISPEFRKTLVLRWRPSEDKTASAGYIESTGKVWLGDGYHSARNLGFPEAGDRYVDAIAQAIGGRVNRSDKGQVTVLTADGRGPEVQLLTEHGHLWRSEIEQLIADTKPSQ